MLTLICPTCHARVPIAHQLLGQVIVCPNCGDRFLAHAEPPSEEALLGYADEAPPVEAPPGPAAPAADGSRDKT
jgi:DNA-directed RNA polymerase subunit RPC12/RpoP